MITTTRKCTPILYQTDMVQAILANIKKQTRRTKGLKPFNENSNLWIYDGVDEDNKAMHWFEAIDENGKYLEKYKSIICPYGNGIGLKAVALNTASNLARTFIGNCFLARVSKSF